MLDHNIIRPATKATLYSQVTLTPKPGGKWRFCIDYRILNECTVNSPRWPLPNIKEMLHRLSERRATYQAPQLTSMVTKNA